MANPVETAVLAERPLAELVHADARAARVLEKFGLDFCCGGRRTLREAAQADGVPLDEVIDALGALGAPTEEDREPAAWKDLDVLVRHILEHHHRYVRDTSPTINAWLDRLVERHGSRHPELSVVRQTFRDLTDRVASHMLKEEHILFPFINDLAAARRGGGRLPMGPFGTILNPVRVMETDHALVGELLGRLRAQSRGFAAPDDACTTYRLCYDELARFEQDLHRHIHLENAVLFPRALELERSLT
jgi:regulator of cell morphogenesis and NO signaling